MNHLAGGTDDQIAVREPGPPPGHGCDLCDFYETEEQGECAVELSDPGRNWLGTLGKDILHVCKPCARQHSGELLERIEEVL